MSEKVAEAREAASDVTSEASAAMRRLTSGGHGTNEEHR
jgi:hypothetical protein